MASGTTKRGRSTSRARSSPSPSRSKSRTGGRSSSRTLRKRTTTVVYRSTSQSRSPSRAASTRAQPSSSGVVSDIGYASLNPVDETSLKASNSIDFNTNSNTILAWLFPLFMMVTCPLVLFYVYVACDKYQCEILKPAMSHLEGNPVVFDTLAAAYRDGTLINVQGAAAYLGFVAVHAILMAILPGKMTLGQLTPAGNRWPYCINGLLSMFVSFGLFYLGAYHFKLFKPTIFYDNWLSAIVTSNIFSFGVVFFCYFKGKFSPSIGPSGRPDVNSSSNVLGDLYKGIELNPRIGDFDLKMFLIGRVGMISWAFVNFSALAKQLEETGTARNSMYLINFIQFFYIFDLLWREEWYLSTIDIMFDRGGFYLFWGVCAWMQVMYCAQSLWLLKNPTNLQTPYLVFVLCLHLLGYTMFLDSNTQRVRFREDLAAANGDASKITVGILGNRFFRSQPTYVTARWIASDGKPRTSYLLTSGYWGLARHFNYVTDLLMCFAFGMTSNTIFGAALPWFYFVFMAILLIHRAIRDERRLLAKYGQDYLKYKEAVPYSMIPGIY